MKKKQRKAQAILFSFYLLVFSLLSGCARQGYPTGGIKDEVPPQALNCKPANGSRNFSANEFYIQFDEYVVLKNPNDNILVSPPMKQQPEYTTKGRGILVKIKDTLQENTTYLFQFKEAIADFNEGNLLPSFEYVFSTGNNMDSLMLEGNVIDPRSNKPWKETVTVAAYQSNNQALKQSSIQSFNQLSIPSFVTRCDKQGNFAFHYIPADTYHLIAFEDKNRNLQPDSTEAIAWDTTAFVAYPSPDSNQILKQSNHQTIKLYISQPETQRQRITSSAFIEKGRIQIVTQLPMQHPVVSGEKVEWRLNSRRDTMNLWCLNPNCDSTIIVLSDTALQDTLRLRFSQKGKGRRQRLGANEEKTPLMKTLCDGNKAFYDDLRLAFENPIVTIHDSAHALIMNLKDSSITFCPVSVDSTGLTARLQTTLQSGEKYHVHLAKGLFTDLYGNTTDSLDFDLTPKDYATLTLHIDNQTEFPLVIEVLDKRDTVVQHLNIGSTRSPTSVQAIKQSSNLTFSHLPAGDYRLRAILDANGDGRWTPGDYRLQRQPEKALFFDKMLSLREKWEMEENWKVVIEEKQTTSGKLKRDKLNILR